MYTIKFQHYSDQNLIIHVNNDDWIGMSDISSSQAEVTSIMEGDEIWHRPFIVHSAKNFDDWRGENFNYSPSVDLHIVNNDPAGAFNKDKANHHVYFELLTFYNREIRFHKCLFFCADCFIMNEAGHTVDNFNA